MENQLLEKKSQGTNLVLIRLSISTIKIIQKKT